MPVPAVTIRPRRSMILVALFSIAMVVLSYVFVLALAAACVLLPYWMMTSTESANGQLVLLFLFGIAIAGAMLWSLVPRLDKFKAPGPVLDKSQHPFLFAELENIAGALNEPMPREVYLIGDLNAWVADRGGFMGFGTTTAVTPASVPGFTKHKMPWSGSSRTSDRLARSHALQSSASCT